MTSFPPSFIQDVRGRTSLVDLIAGSVKLVQRGREHEGLCPFHSERTPSFKVNEGKGFFHCFGCGAHGDAIDFLQKHDRYSFQQAVEYLAVQAGLMPDNGGVVRRPAPVVPRMTDAEREQDEQKRIHDGKRLWLTSLPAQGTLVETYLRSRGIVIAVPGSLRFCPALDYREENENGEWITLGTYPAMIGCIQNARGEITGAHRTYLRHDGSGKADMPKPKKSLGVKKGGAIRFAKPPERLSVAEGIETALSVKQAVPDIEIWSAIDWPNITGSGDGQGELHPDPRVPGQRLPTTEPDMAQPGLVLPDCVRELTIWATRTRRTNWVSKLS